MTNPTPTHLSTNTLSWIPSLEKSSHTLPQNSCNFTLNITLFMLFTPPLNQ